MRITCPSCAAEYDLPAAVPSGRVVRCARCGGEWTPVPVPVPVPVPPPAPEPLPERAAEPQPEAPEPPPRAFLAPPAADRLPARSNPGPRRLPLLLAWTVSVLAVAGMVAAAYVFRPTIMHAWPPSTRMYALLGLA